MNELMFDKAPNRLRRHRKRLKMSQRQFAKHVGVSYSTISRIEAGIIFMPKLDTIRAIEKKLKMKVFF